MCKSRTLADQRSIYFQRQNMKKMTIFSLFAKLQELVYFTDFIDEQLLDNDD